jgi:RNA polymerase sigma-70 factor (ECF subfamily)
VRSLHHHFPTIDNVAVTTGLLLDESALRHETGALVAALTRIFGVANLALAEDVAQDAFCRALEQWRTHGQPQNPTAWLITTAKRRAIDIVRRERTARRFAPELGHLLDSEWTLASLVDEAFAVATVREEQLRMMFSCCHPRIAEEVQLALILHILCGFGVGEVAAAFLVGRAAVEKRISRGKRALAGARRLFDLRDEEFPTRLRTVLRALYLLFNEGYHGVSSESPVRAELCAEAMRLVALLREHSRAATPTTAALGALMALHAARLPARIDAAGDLNALVDQDRSRWDARLVAEGLSLLEQSAAGTEVSAYHVEAAIAAVDAGAPDLAATDWHAIVLLYDRLAAIAPSPIVALSRAIAIGQRDGPEDGLAALAAIRDRERLSDYPFYAAALGELELRRGDRAAARAHLGHALGLARNAAERRFLERRLRGCGG